MHGGTQPTGRDSPNYKHGAFSKHLRSDLTESERAAFDDLVDDLEDPEKSLDAIRRVAAEALMKYKRSADSRFLREFRQIADTFNLAPNEDRVELDADLGVRSEVVEITEDSLTEE